MEPRLTAFAGSVWTCARVAKVIEEEFGVAYEKSQVSRLLKRLKMDAADADQTRQPAR